MNIWQNKKILLLVSFLPVHVSLHHLHVMKRVSVSTYLNVIQKLKSNSTTKYSSLSVSYLFLYLLVELCVCFSLVSFFWLFLYECVACSSREKFLHGTPDGISSRFVTSHICETWNGRYLKQKKQKWKNEVHSHWAEEENEIKRRCLNS